MGRIGGLRRGAEESDIVVRVNRTGSVHGLIHKSHGYVGLSVILTLGSRSQSKELERMRRTHMQLQHLI